MFAAIASPPAIVDVAIVDVALKNPNVGVDVAVITPDALVESRELIATDDRVVAPETVNPPFRVCSAVNVLAVYVFGIVVEAAMYVLTLASV